MDTRLGWHYDPSQNSPKDVMYSMAVGAVWDLGELSGVRGWSPLRLLNAGVPLNCLIYFSGWWDAERLYSLRRMRADFEAEYRSDGMGFGCSL